MAVDNVGAMTERPPAGGVGADQEAKGGKNGEKNKDGAGFLKRNGIFLALAVFLVLFFMPTPAGMAPAGQKADRKSVV